MQTDHPLGPAIAAWLESAGTDLNFHRWHGGGRHDAELSNWIVLVHASEKIVYDSQWMPAVGDLAEDAEPAWSKPGVDPMTSEAANPAADDCPPGLAAARAAA